MLISCQCLETVSKIFFPCYQLQIDETVDIGLLASLAILEEAFYMLFFSLF